jgi:predicted peptidase
MPHKQIPITTKDFGYKPQFGYYEYTPDTYKKGSGKKWPAILFLHGAGEKGNSSTELSKVLKASLPKVIEDGKFPGKDQFVVLSPQTWGFFTPAFLKEFVKHIFKQYDIDKLFLAAYSYGSFAFKQYADEFNGEVEFAAVIDVAGNGINEAEACDYADIPIWFFTGAKDTNAPTNPKLSISAYEALNKCPERKVKAKLTVYSNGSHSSITPTAPFTGEAQPTDPKYDPQGDIYKWMLSLGSVEVPDEEPEEEEPKPRKLIATVKVFDDGSIEKS